MMDDTELLYFDHAASAPRRPEVFDAMAPYAQGVVGNPTGSHRAARAARKALDDAREEIADLTGSLPGGVIFTGGGSESCNLAVFGVAADRTRRGRCARLAVSAIEHHAVLDAARRLERGLLAAPVEVGTMLIAAALANNETGVVQPVAQVAAAAKAASKDVVVHTDAVAAAPWLDLRTAAKGADLMTICAHKLGGPIGIGALCVRREVALAPLVVGGGQERGRRGGTPDVAAAVGLAVALRLACTEREAAVALTTSRRDQLAKLLMTGIEGANLTADGAEILPGTCHVTIDGVASEELVFLCDAAGLCVAAASSCSSGASAPSHVLAAMGMEPDRARGSLRLTIGSETTDVEVERAAAVVTTAVLRLRGQRSA